MLRPVTCSIIKELGTAVRYSPRTHWCVHFSGTIFVYEIYECCNMMSLLRDRKFVSRDRIVLSRDKSVDFTVALLCRATLFECLRHNHLSLRQVPMM